MSKIDVSVLRIDDARELAPLLAAYTQDMKRGAPRSPDEYYAELLLTDRTAEVLGGRLDGELVGFVTFFDLPDNLTGRRAGQIDDIFVLQDKRKNGVATAMIGQIKELGKKRGWTRVRWVIPDLSYPSQALYEAHAEPSATRNFTIHLEEDRDKTPSPF